jgi:hypothetical protein
MKKMMNFALMAAMVCGLSLAVTSCKDDDKNDGGGSSQTPGLTGIFKEPVLIMRLMKVTDNGGTTPNLTAQDGTKLTVVKLVENPYLYNNNLVPMINYMLRTNYQQSLIFLDNQPYQSDYKF